MLDEQVEQWWLRRRGRALQPAERQALHLWVNTAAERLRPHASLEGCLQAAGVQVELSQDAHQVAGVRFRARLDAGRRRLKLYARALDELQAFCPDRALLTRVILAHETFHLLCPQCPGRLQEAAAHLFAAVHCGLEQFPGNWDYATE
jgi:hypothetical protein